MNNVVNREYPSLIGKRPFPMLRVLVLADGYPSGTAIFRSAPDQQLYVQVPPEGNVAWMNASTWVQLSFYDFKWIDDRTLFCRVGLTVDNYLAGEPTPVTLFISDAFCSPCGMVNFSKRIQEWQSTRPDNDPKKIHAFSVVFDHYAD